MERISDGVELLRISAPSEVDSVSLSNDSTRLLVLLGDGSLFVLDSRNAADHLEDARSIRTARALARPIVDALLAGSIPWENLERELAAREDLDSGERLAGLEMLHDEIRLLDGEAGWAIFHLTANAKSTQEGRSAIADADLPPRVRERAMLRVANWEYTPPASPTSALLADETRRRRLAEASLSLSEMLAWDTPPKHFNPEPIATALATREDLLGVHDTLTAEARWILGTLRMYQDDSIAGLALMRAAADDLAADPDADPRLIIGVTYNLMQSELSIGTLENAQARLSELLTMLERQLESKDEDALALWSVAAGYPFRPGYGYQRILPTPITSLEMHRSRDAQKAILQQWLDRARSLGLRELLAREGVGFWIIDIGTEGAPYGVVIPKDEVSDLVRLIPDAPSVRCAQSLRLLRRGEYEAAKKLAEQLDQRTQESGGPELAITLAVRAIASARLGDDALARSLRERLAAAKSRPKEWADGRDAQWWSSIEAWVNSDQAIDSFLRELDDTLAGHPPVIGR